MNAEYAWWIVALVLVGGGGVAFLALGRLPEIGEADESDDPGPNAGGAPTDERSARRAAGRTAAPGAGLPQSRPVRTTVPGPDEAASTSETP